MLPQQLNLPVHILASCFNNTTATYKFYWFLSIIQALEVGKKRISKNELFARMIANSWYTINYFKVSFGKFDKLQDAIHKTIELENLQISDKQNLIIDRLLSTKNSQTLKILKSFDKNVPHWFLSPWFSKLNKQKIYEFSQKFENNCLYLN